MGLLRKKICNRPACSDSSLWRRSEIYGPPKLTTEENRIVGRREEALPGCESVNEANHFAVRKAREKRLGKELRGQSSRLMFFENGEVATTRSSPSNLSQTPIIASVLAK